MGYELTGGYCDMAIPESDDRLWGGVDIDSDEFEIEPVCDSAVFDVWEEYFY